MFAKSYSHPVGSILLVVVGLILTARPSLSLYDTSSDVVELTPENLKSKVLDDDVLWIVEFYAPWCHHCKELVKAYKEVACRGKGLFRVGAIDVDKYPALGQEYNIQGFPTIKAFGKDKKHPETVQSARSADAIINAIVEHIKFKSAGEPPCSSEESGRKSSGANKKAGQPKKDGDVVVLDDSNFDDFMGSSKKKLVFVKFFAPWCGHCVKMAPDFKIAATSIKDAAIFAEVDCTTNQKLATRFGIKGFPTLKLIQVDKHGKIRKVVDYASGRSAEEMVQWVRSHENTLEPEKVELSKVATQEQLEEMCYSKTFCFVAVLPHPDEISEAERADLIKLVNSAIEDVAGPSRWGWIWIDGSTHLTFEETFEIDQLTNPVMLGIHVKDKLKTINRLAFTRQNLGSFFKGIIHGHASVSPFKELPKLSETASEASRSEGDL